MKQGSHNSLQPSSRTVPSNEVYNLSLLYYLILIIHKSPLNRYRISFSYCYQLWVINTQCFLDIVLQPAKLPEKATGTKPLTFTSSSVTCRHIHFLLFFYSKGYSLQICKGIKDDHCPLWYDTDQTISPVSPTEAKQFLSSTF